VAYALDVRGERGARQKNVFGGRGYLRGKSACAIVFEGARIVKTPAADSAAALAEPGVTAVAPAGARPMSTWVVVEADAIADDPELADWLHRGLRAVR
jgi:hypothetical protein